MAYEFPPDIQHIIDLKMASGLYPSEDRLLLTALHSLSDYECAIADIREGIADEAAGRTRSFAEVDAGIRREFGFGT